MKKIIDYLIWGLMPWNVIFGVVGLVVLCSFIINQIKGYECVVVETGYYHSTNKEDKCHFIKLAKSRDYTIKKINRSKAIDNNYKICHECFSQKEQEWYNKSLAFHNHLDNYSKWLKEHINEDLGWNTKLYKQDYDSLYVYIDSKDVLHISSTCGDLADDPNPQKTRFNDVESIFSTCENCVGREFVDFIYKKIHEGVYDLSQIKEIDEDED